MSGALVGFLRYNAPPARIYLGDTGSMLIGWVVAAVAIRSSIKEQAAVALAVPLAICAIPILDALAALVRRITTGQSVFTADRGHLHHALMLRGWTVGQTAALAAGLTAITCLGAIVSYFTRIDAFALLSLGGVVLALAASRIFGHSELALLATHIRSLGRGALGRVRPAGTASSADHVVQLQGRRQWNLIWSALREAAAVHDLVSVRLNINIPHLHESFYASWKASGGVAEDNVWRIAMPLHVAGRPVGRLLIAGRAGKDNLAAIQQALDYLEPIEAEMTRLVEDAAPEANPFRLESDVRPSTTDGGPPLRTVREATTSAL
jgi:UDP-GlcNAc:undecaprenyl-phosphate GlcNAc-1-phosphate transferase